MNDICSTSPGPKLGGDNAISKFGLAEIMLRNATNFTPNMIEATMLFGVADCEQLDPSTVRIECEKMINRFLQVIVIPCLFEAGTSIFGMINLIHRKPILKLRNISNNFFLSYIYSYLF